MKNTIAFPGLHIPPFTMQNSFNVFGFTIHWYGVIIALGILAAYLFCSKIVKDYGLTNENLIDIILCGLPSAIVGARAYYVIFEWENILKSVEQNPETSLLYETIAIWEGGLAIYGGVIGACLSTFLYCKIKKIPVSQAFDVGAFGLLIGQIFGRWGNFVNVEAFGGLTALPWRMELIDCWVPEHLRSVGLPMAVHPTFLYESLWNLGVFCLLFAFRKKMKFSGQVFLSYIVLYGLGRFWIEGLRTDSLFIGTFRISQILAGMCVICGLLVIFRLLKSKRQEN